MQSGIPYGQSYGQSYGQPYGQQGGFVGQQPQQFNQATQTQLGAPLILRIIEARGLKKSDLTGKSDPYCVIKFKKGLVGSLLNHDKLMTRVVEKNCNPIWNEEFVLHPHHPDMDIIQIQVFDKDRIGADSFLGKVDLPVAQYWKRGLIDEWIPLSPKKKVNKPAFGELHLLVSYSESGMTGVGGQQQQMGAPLAMGTGMGMGQAYGSSYGQSGLSSGYGTSSYGTTSGLTSGYGYGTSGYGTSSGLGYGQSGLGTTSGYIPSSSGLTSGYVQRGISSGVPASSVVSSGYGIPSSYGTQTLGKEFSSGSYGIPSYGTSGMHITPGYGASNLGTMGSGLGGAVNYPPPVARHQDKW